jgi:hypothetical protein
MHDQNTVFCAIALSVVILITWQYFFATSFLGKPTAQKTSQVGDAQKWRPDRTAKRKRDD